MNTTEELISMYDELFASITELEKKVTYARYLLMEENPQIEKINSACISVEAQAIDTKILAASIKTTLSLNEQELEIFELEGSWKD
jgi:hypothetical protein